MTATARSTPVDPAKRLDPAKVRADFPILDQAVNGHPLAYLDSAASSQKPQRVLDALTDYYTHHNANIHRGVHTLSQRATDLFERARKTAANFIGASRPEEIVFLRGATEAINLVAQSFVRPDVGPGDEILITHMEHHSNIVPWQMVCEQTGAALKVAPINDRGELILEELDRLITPKTKILACVHVSNALGTINPVRDITRMAHAKGVPVLLDGCQAIPHMPVNVRDIGCDFYVASAHKALGPTGTGFLWAKHELLEAMPPYQGGGEMILSVTFDKTIYNEVPHKFEAGTPDIAGVVGFGAAMEYLLELGMDNVHAAEHELLEYGTAALRNVPGIRMIGTAAHKASVMSFTMTGMGGDLDMEIHPHDIGTILDQEGVAVRTGHHCAQPVMERFGISATTRASIAVYNTRDDVDRLIAGLHKVREVFGA